MQLLFTEVGALYSAMCIVVIPICFWSQRRGEGVRIV